MLQGLKVTEIIAAGLKHEKFLWQVKAGPYGADPWGIFAERVEELISTKHAKWVTYPEEGWKTSEISTQ